MNRTGLRVMCIVCNLEVNFEGNVEEYSRVVFHPDFPANVLEATSNIGTLGCVDATSRFDEVKWSDVIGSC